jgi:hypothetical protein
MSLLSRPDLGRLKRFARALQKSAASGDSAALDRLRVFFAGITPDVVKLSHAQLVIAREYRSSSWPDLVARVEKRVAKRKAADERRQARKDDAYALAERWFSLARADDIDGLVRAFAVGKCRMVTARVLMQRDTVTYEAFLDVLLRGTTHANPRIRFECAHALDTFGSARCRDALIRLMDDPVPRVRWMAMHAVSCHACNDATCVDDEALHRRIAHSALTDESIQVRRHATAALGMIGALSEIDTLRTIVANDTDPALLRAARFALAKATANAS